MTVAQQARQRAADGLQAVADHLDAVNLDAVRLERAGEDARVALLDPPAQDLVAGDEDRRARTARPGGQPALLTPVVVISQVPPVELSSEAALPPIVTLSSAGFVARTQIAVERP